MYKLDLGTEELEAVETALKNTSKARLESFGDMPTLRPDQGGIVHVSPVQIHHILMALNWSLAHMPADESYETKKKLLWYRRAKDQIIGQTKKQFSAARSAEA